MKTFLKHMMIHLQRSDAVLISAFFPGSVWRAPTPQPSWEDILGSKHATFFLDLHQPHLPRNFHQDKGWGFVTSEEITSLFFGKAQTPKKTQRGELGSFLEKARSIVGKRFPNIQVFIAKINSQLSVCGKGTKMELIQLTFFVDILAGRQDIFLHSKQLNDTSLEPQGCLQTECFYIFLLILTSCLLLLLHLSSGGFCLFKSNCLSKKFGLRCERVEAIAMTSFGDKRLPDLEVEKLEGSWSYNRWIFSVWMWIFYLSCLDSWLKNRERSQ